MTYESTDPLLRARDADVWCTVVTALLRNPPASTNVELVRLDQRHGTWHYRYAREDSRTALRLPASKDNDRVADLRAGDLLLYAPAPGMAEAARDGLFEHLRRIGVELHIVLAPGAKLTDMADELVAHAHQIIPGLRDNEPAPVAALLGMLSLPRSAC